MRFREVLAISGQPGLYKYLAQGKNGIIVESLTDGKRFQVSANARVSSLNDIAIYTEGEDMPLGEVYQAISNKLNGGAAIDHKSKPEMLVAAFSEYLPVYDKNRVRPSDIKKAISWYNILQAAGMTNFIEEPANEEQVAEQTESTETKAE